MQAALIIFTPTSKKGRLFMKYVNKLVLFLPLILATQVVHAMVGDSLQKMFHDLCQEMPEPYVPFTGRYTIKDDTLRIPKELLHKRLDNIALGMLNLYDFTDHIIGINDDYESYNLT